MRSTKDRLTVILRPPPSIDHEGPQTNWFEIQRPLTRAYVESAAVAQDIDRVLLDICVLLRPPHIPSVEGTRCMEDEELANQRFRLQTRTTKSPNPVYISKPTSWNASHIPLPPIRIRSDLPCSLLHWGDVRSPLRETQDPAEHGGIDRSEGGCRWCYRPAISSQFLIARHLVSC